MKVSEKMQRAKNEIGLDSSQNRSKFSFSSLKMALRGCVHITYALWMGGWVTKGSTKVYMVGGWVQQSVRTCLLCRESLSHNSRNELKVAYKLNHV